MLSWEDNLWGKAVSPSPIGLASMMSALGKLGHFGTDGWNRMRYRKDPIEQEAFWAVETLRPCTHNRNNLEWSI